MKRNNFASPFRKTCFFSPSLLFFLLFFFFLSFPLIFSFSAFAAQLSLAWDPNTEPDLAGYKVYYGTASRTYGTPIDVGKVTGRTITGLTQGRMYYFSVTAYDSSGKESGFSNEVSRTASEAGTSQYSLTTGVSPAGGGTVSPSGTNWYNSGQSVSIKATANPGYIFTGWSGNLSGTTNPASIVMNGSKSITASFVSQSGTAPQLGMVQIWMEAEDGIGVLPMVVGSDGGASSGQYVWVPNGSGNLYNYPSQSGGSVSYTFSVPVAGTYVVWGRVMVDSTGGNNDSFFVSMDSGSYVLWETLKGVSAVWGWDRVSNRGGADPVVFSLSAGEHTLMIKQREDGTKLDRILITNDLAYVPQEQGEAEELGQIWMEAEDGIGVLPMVVGSDGGASSGQYVWVPNGSGNLYNNPLQSGGSVSYTFSLPVAGNFVVWGRGMAKSGDDDSFWVSMDSGSYFLWDMWSGSYGAWGWALVNHRGSGSADPVVFSLSAGEHTLVIKQREDGTKLDRILITNDLAYVPQGLGE